jgi:hypothetical protein
VRSVWAWHSGCDLSHRRQLALPHHLGLGGGTPTKTELNSEPIRLTFDASKAIWGPKYAQFVTTWVAWRYWQNKFGLDHNAMFGVCTQSIPFGNPAGAISTNSCTEQTVYAGVTVKF